MSRRANIPSDGFYVPAANGGAQLTVCLAVSSVAESKPIEVTCFRSLKIPSQQDWANPSTSSYLLSRTRQY